ncbi:hypothetical protein BJX99DRAFT_259895 [Aspergillus californicus]
MSPMIIRLTRNGTNTRSATQNISAQLSYDPGAERVAISGYSSLLFLVDHHRSSYDPTIFILLLTAEWEFLIDMTSINEGGVVFKVNEDVEPRVTITQDHEGRDYEWTEGADVVADSYYTRFTAKFIEAINDQRERLYMALANSNRPCLPGAGWYLMKDPIFSNNGGLLVRLEFNSSSSPEQVQTTTTEN